MNLATAKPGTPDKARAELGARVAARLDANPACKRIKTTLADAWYMPDFVSDAECAMLIRLIDAGRRPSTLLTESHYSNFRTSESCDLDRWSPQVQPIDERIADLLGIDPPHGETMQGQRYAPGQQFRAHHDFFHEDREYWPRMQQDGGQRTWTAMAYLSDVAEGGATWFPQGGFKVPPRKRMLLVWNNMAADGAPNHATLHEGMAVQRGVKYVVTKWFRERPWV